MIKKLTLLLSLTIFLYGCGYSPIYNSSTNSKFDLEVINLEGDNFINRSIKSNLNRYSKKDSDKNFKIKINTIFEKKDLSKDATGKISNYQVIIISTFNISSSSSEKTIIIKENFNLQNSQNTFERQKYEKSIRKSFAESAVNKLVLELIKM